jgi:hypothetical protein
MTAPTSAASLQQTRGNDADTVIPPVIPTTPVTPALLEALRAIVGDKGLIQDEPASSPSSPTGVARS